MIQSIEKKVVSRIYGRGRGWAFTKTDFVAEFDEANIHQALSSLTEPTDNKEKLSQKTCCYH